MSRSSPLQQFLKEHTYKKDKDSRIQHTHTRIRDDKYSVKGGAYYIVGADLDKFYRLYHEHVFLNGNKEFLTESQIQSTKTDVNVFGPILLDFDFKHPQGTTKRLINEEHIISLVSLYLEKLQKYFEFSEDAPFPIYVMQKPNINIITNSDGTQKIKDGLHIVIGLQMSHAHQIALREDVKKDVALLFDDIPLDNEWDDILDMSITSGSTNWMVYGSCKPGNEVYRLTKLYNVFYSSENPSDPFGIQTEDHESFTNNVENFTKMSAQYEKHVRLILKESVASMLISDTGSKRRPNNNIRVIDDDEVISIQNICTKEQLFNLVNRLVEREKAKYNNYIVKETHDYTMILPDEYSENYELWLKTGMALRNTSDKLFLTWMAFSAKSDKFSCSDIPTYYEKWRRFDTGLHCLSSRSITYWAKQHWDEVSKSGGVNEYKKIRDSSLDHYIDQSIKNKGQDYDLAMVLYIWFKDNYVNVSYNKNIWYEYNGHRWVELEAGVNLLKNLSEEIHNIYQVRMFDSVNTMQVTDRDEPEYKAIEKKVLDLTNLCQRLRSHTHKANIFKEAKLLFYDKDFYKRMDTNDYLLCFKNGVYDFKNKEFRNGHPEDYITKSTNIDYIPYNDVLSHHSEVKRELEIFMEQLYSDKDLRTFMWALLSTFLIGGNINQKMYMFIGKGSNGKSMITSILQNMMGEYCGQLVESYLVNKRQGIGSATPEIMSLMGTRLAIVNEPSKNQTINDGVMKELTGGTDMITGRKLYGDTVSFIPKFTPMVCTNNLYQVNSNDNGTWRRINKIDHTSSFKELKDYNASDSPDDIKGFNMFVVDKSIEDSKIKSKIWPRIMMSMLVELAKENMGVIVPCDAVIASSDAYRQQEDHLSAFITERVVANEGKKVKKGELQTEFPLWYRDTYGKRPPKITELYDAMDAKFGKYTNRGWKNVTIQYEDDEEDEAEMGAF